MRPLLTKSKKTSKLTKNWALKSSKNQKILQKIPTKFIFLILQKGLSLIYEKVRFATSSYRGRANCENCIKELKYDFGADSFNQKNFFATEATLSKAIMAFNFMSLFRKTLIKGTTNQTLKTLRYKLFAIPGYVTNSGRRQTLNLALALKRREWVNGLWERSSSFINPVLYSSIFEPSRERVLWGSFFSNDGSRLKLAENPS